MERTAWQGLEVTARPKLLSIVRKSLEYTCRIPDILTLHLPGLIESFDQEVEPLGYIKNLIIKPGLFRTQFQSKVRDSLPSDSKHYQWLADEYAQSLDQIIGQQPGDPVRLADVVFDIVHEKDIRGNSTREAPLSLPLGKDAFDEMVESCERTLKTLRQWEDVVKSTDFPP